MKKKTIIDISLILVTLILVSILVSFFYDSYIVKSIASVRNSLFDDILLGITFVSSEIIIFFFLTSLFLWQERKRKWILPLWLTLFITIVVSFLLKIAVKRSRPFQQGIVETLPILQSANFLTWNFSFPSFQAMMVFSAVPILNKEFPRFKYVWIAFACLVALSRVYFGLHYMSDVLLGGVIGYAIGWMVVKVFDRK